MKHSFIFSIFLVVSLFMLSSCNEDILNSDNIDASEVSKTKSSVTTNVPDLITQLYSANIPLNITLFGETNSFMAARQSSGQVQLDGRDVGTGRERWYIKRDYRGFYLQVVGGYHKGWRNLCMSNPTQTVAYLTDDAAMSKAGYMFNVDFENVSNTDRYLIRLAKGYTNRSDVYLTAVGSKIHFKNKGTARQQWVMSPIGEYEIIDIDYKILAGDKLDFKPIIVRRMTYENMYDTKVEKTFSFTETVKNTSEFKETTGLSVTTKVSSSFGFKVPLFADGNMTTETTTNTNWSYTTGKILTNEITFNETMKQEINPYDTVTAEFIVSEYRANISYILTLRSLLDPTKIIYTTGKWSGTIVQDGKIKIYDSSNRLLKSSK
ncbi:hypothetical protein JGH11_04540 [Dysgonomonas sp. Marseille-P4677]|uniref:hypothetical protein n=1 Tax=Dysgonomonas sp. Marseille-P4677 TaxID=2364790 RepID=UPI0019128D06|nr:hypothetical protein [Dysgonomonas sp. Marseille-P4677]MBK5720135.1 hypothetical protein [Dysgonomonas sp. Marseille-P4677]